MLPGGCKGWAGGVKVVVKEEVLLGERSGGLECYCVVMINVSQIFLFILTDESCDERSSSALLLLVVQHKPQASP